jgi:hypothetical protein
MAGQASDMQCLAAIMAEIFIYPHLQKHANAKKKPHE